jgi:DNA polymerase elongation subunit (family B)
MRRLLFDIETSLGKAYVFGAGYEINVPASQLFEYPKIICIAYKWAGQKKTYCLDWGKDRCDKKLLKTFIGKLKEADEIIGHNSDRFDIKWIRGRCFFHKIPMMPEYTSIDTYKEAKKMKLESYGLDHINKLMGHAGKAKTDFQLWVDTTEGNQKALAKMKRYCVGDVLRLEETYNDMRPYMKVKTSIAVKKDNCPYCDSDRIGVDKYAASAAGVRYVRFRCKNCGQSHKVTQASFDKAKK